MRGSPQLGRLVEQAESMTRQVRMIDRGRADSVAGQREMTRLLVIVLALSPYTRATDAPHGQLGRPIEAAPRPLAVPAQRPPSEPRFVPRGTATPPRRRAR